MEDILSKNSPEVAELIQKMLKCRGEDSKKYLAAANELYDLAQAHGNTDLKDYASCTYGDACCSNLDFPRAYFYISAGIKGLAETDEYMLLSQCYNELGIIYRSQGHYITSEEFYLRSIDVARANRLYLREAIACSNFAALCEMMGAMGDALVYHQRSLECCNLLEDHKVRDNFLVGEYALITKVNVQLDNLQEAKKYLDKMEHLLETYSEYDDYFDITIARWHYYRAAGDRNRADSYKADCIKCFYDCEDYVTYFDELIAFLELMMLDKEYKELEKVCKRIESHETTDETLDLRIHMEQTRIVMYEKIGDEARMMASSYSYFKLVSMRDAESRKSFTTMLRLRSELEQQKTKNLFLSAAAETDPLTGIANRLKLNTVIDELFNMANTEGKTLGVEMMDVDYFKQINDTFGHAKGDALLEAIGRILREMSSENEKIFVARYGGDEFIIYYYDMTDEEIIAKIRHIHDRFEEIAKEMGFENVSLSQGVVNRIPSDGNRAWDHLNTADYTLYYVKEHGKANARLVHWRSELDSKEWNKVF